MNDRAQLTGTPIPIVSGVVTGIAMFVGSKVATAMGFDPLVGAGYVLAILAVLHLFVAVPLRGGRSDF